MVPRLNGGTTPDGSACCSSGRPTSIAVGSMRLRSPPCPRCARESQRRPPPVDPAGVAAPRDGGGESGRRVIRKGILPIRALWAFSPTGVKYRGASRAGGRSSRKPPAKQSPASGRDCWCCSINWEGSSGFGLASGFEAKRHVTYRDWCSIRKATSQRRGRDCSPRACIRSGAVVGWST